MQRIFLACAVEYEEGVTLPNESENMNYLLLLIYPIVQICTIHANRKQINIFKVIERRSW